jgi:tRNA U55 pseudouridine synthase TruB
MPMWWWSQQGYTIENIKTKNITFYEKKITSISNMKGEELKDLILNNLSKVVSGDFRKNDIVNQWENYSFNDSYVTFDCKLSVSSGFYVRQFIRDLSVKLKTKLLVLDIHRVEIF